MLKIAVFGALIALGVATPAVFASAPAGQQEYFENLPTPDGKQDPGSGSKKNAKQDGESSPAPDVAVEAAAPASELVASGKTESASEKKKDNSKNKNEKKKNNKQGANRQGSDSNQTQVASLAASTDPSGGIGIGVLLLMAASLAVAAAIGVARHRAGSNGGP